MRGPTIVLALTLFASGNLTAMAPAHPADHPNPRDQKRSSQRVSPRPLISFQDGLLSVRIYNISWGAVVEELERQTGLLIRADGQWAGTLTQEFEAVPLEQGLRRLFRNANLLFFYAAPQAVPEARLTRVWLFPKEGSLGEERQMRTSAPGTAAAGKQEKVDLVKESTEPATQEEGDTVAAEDDQGERLMRLEDFAWQGNIEALQQAIFDPDQTVQMEALQISVEQNQQEAIALLLSATRSDQPERRFQALNLLHLTGYADERTILSALSEALTDEDANVKGYAIQALAERRGSEALGTLRPILHDPDPTIRMTVIEHIVPEDQGLMLLQEALSDDDETLRSAAASKLEEDISKTP